MCPACGGLECLCRPRFFAGQLLTEDDLNRLDNYIVAKNRLHNRYLVGWGVACGLEVVCNVCGPDQTSGGVLVKPGYALSPCGNDIVVCKPEPVDVCALVNACRPAQDSDCSDMFASPEASAASGKADPNNIAGATIAKGACDGGTEDWILAVCYNEKPARGLTALLRANTHRAGGCSSCGSSGGYSCNGGSGSGGCGCGSKSGSGGSKAGAKGGCGCGSTVAAPNANSASALPDQCEPTMTCEGYRFVVYKAPKPTYTTRHYGDAAKRFLCCILPLFEELGAPPKGDQASQQQAIDWVYTLRDAIRDFIVNEGFYDCQIAARFTMISIPSAGSTAAPKDLYAGLTESAYGYVSIGLLALQKCLCAALLPPCPDTSQLDCVPLATLSVARGGKCRVLKVCNLAARKFLVTIPNITYWLSFFNIFDTGKNGVNSFRALLEKLCCVTPATYTRGELGGLNLFQVAEGLTKKARKTAKSANAQEADAGVLAARSKNAFASLLSEALANPDRNVSVQNLHARRARRDRCQRTAVRHATGNGQSDRVPAAQPARRADDPAGPAERHDGQAASLRSTLGRGRFGPLRRPCARTRGSQGEGREDQQKTIAALKKRK